MSNGERKGGISSCTDMFDIAKIAKGKIQRLMTSEQALSVLNSFDNRLCYQIISNFISIPKIIQTYSSSFYSPENYLS